MLIERIQSPDPAVKLRKPEKFVAEVKKTATSTAVTFDEDKRKAREEDDEAEHEEKEEESAATSEETLVAEPKSQPQAGRINVTA